MSFMLIRTRQYRHDVSYAYPEQGGGEDTSKERRLVHGVHAAWRPPKELLYKKLQSIAYQQHSGYRYVYKHVRKHVQLQTTEQEWP